MSLINRLHNCLQEGWRYIRCLSRSKLKIFQYAIKISQAKYPFPTYVNSIQLLHLYCSYIIFAVYMHTCIVNEKHSAYVYIIHVCKYIHNLSNLRKKWWSISLVLYGKYPSNISCSKSGGRVSSETWKYCRLFRIGFLFTP